jgi:hypothetical protein
LQLDEERLVIVVAAPSKQWVVGIIIVGQVEQTLQVHPHATLVPVDGLPVLVDSLYVSGPVTLLSELGGVLLEVSTSFLVDTY